MLLLFSQKSFSQSANNLAPAGNVGIGTTTPQSTLQVVGATQLSGTVAIDSATVLKDSLRVEGKVILKQKIVVKGKATFTKDVKLKQNLTVDSNLTVGGNSTVKGDLILKSPSLNGYTGLLSLTASGHITPFPPTLNPCYSAVPFWMKVGNGGTNPGTSASLGPDFFGTCDNADLSIRTNSTERMRIDGATGVINIGGSNILNVDAPATNSMLYVKANTASIGGITSFTQFNGAYRYNIKAIVDGPPGDPPGNSNSASHTKAFAVENNQFKQETFVVYGSGQTIIGNKIPQVNTGFMLSVSGQIVAQDVLVENSDWADYVFKPNYHLMPLEQVAKYIGMNNHLPDVPTEADIKKDGNDLGTTQVLLLKKVEELMELQPFSRHFFNDLIKRHLLSY